MPNGTGQRCRVTVQHALQQAAAAAERERAGHGWVSRLHAAVIAAAGLRHGERPSRTWNTVRVSGVATTGAGVEWSVE